MSQIRAVLSYDDERILDPSGEKARSFTMSVCPLRVRTFLPVVSHIQIVRSVDDVAILVPAEFTASPQIAPSGCSSLIDGVAAGSL